MNDEEADPSSKKSRSKGDEESATKDTTSGLLFDDETIRATFVRKVFIIVAVMLLVNIVMCAPVFVCEPFKSFIAEHIWINILALLIFMATYMVLVCFHSVSRTFPLNITLLVIFTLAAGLLLITISAMVPAYTVLLALVATAATCGGIILYASQTTFDVTSKIFIIYAVSLAVFIFGIGIAIASLFVHIKWLGVIFSAIVCVLFMVHLALDTQMILGGRKYEISPEEYIYAALILFVDIYEIFVNLVNLINAAR